MTEHNEREMRSAFEHWYSDGGEFPKAVERSGDNYLFLQAATAWSTWQAAWAAATLGKSAAMDGEG